MKQQVRDIFFFLFGNRKNEVTCEYLLMGSYENLNPCEIKLSFVHFCYFISTEREPVAEACGKRMLKLCRKYNQTHLIFLKFKNKSFLKRKENLL